jgi:recombinational DNA repair protein (RecF pathway)
MVSGRAPTSKFSPHVDPLNLLTVRLVKKSRYTLADAVGEDRFQNLRNRPKAFAEALRALTLLTALVPEEEPDPRLFHEMRRALVRGHLTVRATLPLLGYDPRGAKCHRCRRAAVACFVPSEGVFLCVNCSAVWGDEVIYV